ncbi:MAG: tyrosine-type recombinase/integrase [Candidatus Bathyarchaeia archaeon]
MQRLAREDGEIVDELQGLISEVASPRERKARQYIVSSFKGKMASLIPFSYENESIIKLASYLLKYTTGSKYTLYQYVFGVHRFSKWINRKPDDMVGEALLDKRAADNYIRKMDDFVGDLQAEGLAPGTINNHVKGVRALFRINGVNLELPYRVPKKVMYPDRAPTPEELAKVIDMADIREKVIVSLLALSGVRIGTLVKLQYRHVKKDLENGTVPVHMHIEAEITKGKYHDYDTFIGSEGVEYLKAYLSARRAGNERMEGGRMRGMPPEEITDSSPLIRNEHQKTTEIVSPGIIHCVIHSLYLRTGLIQKGSGRRYQLRAHSIRKYFRTQLGSISTIPTDYIEYMMGHTISTYNDIKMKGVEYLRNLYASSGLSIRPKTRISKIERLKMFAESLGLNPNEVLSEDALAMPHRTVVDPEQRKIEVLNQALKEAILKELRQ